MVPPPFPQDPPFVLGRRSYDAETALAAALLGVPPPVPSSAAASGDLLLAGHRSAPTMLSAANHGNSSSLLRRNSCPFGTSLSSSLHDPYSVPKASIYSRLATTTAAAQQQQHPLLRQQSAGNTLLLSQQQQQQQQTSRRTSLTLKPSPQLPLASAVALLERQHQHSYPPSTTIGSAPISLRQDQEEHEAAILNDAYNRGRQEAILSLLQSKTTNHGQHSRLGALPDHHESLLVTAAAAPSCSPGAAAAAAAGLSSLRGSRPLDVAALAAGGTMGRGGPHHQFSILGRNNDVLHHRAAATAAADTSAFDLLDKQHLVPSRRRSSDEEEEMLQTLGSTVLERRKRNAPYFDASLLQDPDPVTLANRRPRGGVTEPFPEKLHRMLTDAEVNGTSDVVSFLPHGRAFSIHNVERFCLEIMPLYFNQSRLGSFQRQLNLYGFTRIPSGPDAGAYYHELFLRGRPALVIHMRRVGVPRVSSSGSASDDEKKKKSQDDMPTLLRNRSSSLPSAIAATPDFYRMDPIRGATHIRRRRPQFSDLSRLSVLS